MTAMLTDGEILLRAILATPEDDAPRLIYADWLEENGEEERAEFIRVQCELGSLGFGNPEENQIRRSDRIGELARRQRSLWVKPETSSWFGGTSYIALGRSVFETRYDNKSCSLIRRGFADEVRCTLADWMKHGPAIVRTQPVTRVVLTDVVPWPSSRAEDRVVLWDKRSFREEQLGREEDITLTRSGIIDNDIYQFLRDGVSYPSDKGLMKYETSQIALDDLSQACLTWAKSQVRAAQTPPA
jgi:uncharacterized protein (TIGR02996 family)